MLGVGNSKVNLQFQGNLVTENPSLYITAVCVLTLLQILDEPLKIISMNLFSKKIF